jgi:6-phosphogluconolactonase
MQTIKILPTQDDLVTTATGLFLSTASKTIQEQGRFSLALSGGSTPLPLYERLAQEEYDHSLDWSRIHFFWGDERTVPQDHPESNYFQAAEALLSPRKIPEKNIHRVQGELEPVFAAEEYQHELRDWFQHSPPRFDLVLLGLGGDGHTASLFPGTEVMTSPQDYDLVAAIHVPRLDTWRITFTTKLINFARLVMFIVSGRSKAEILFKVLEDPGSMHQYPAQSIQPTDGELIWLVDQDAGSLLTTVSLEE